MGQRDVKPASVSVILPTFNRADLLSRCLDSLVAQTFLDWEVIVVDDGSTDHTRDVLAGYTDPRIRVVGQPNRKLPEALNTGHRAATGQLLTWVSDDCWMEPGWLEGLCVGLHRLDRPWGMVFSDYWFHSHDGRESRVVATTASSLKTRNQIGCSFLYRREVFETIGPYDPAMLGAEDWDYWLRVAARFPMAHLPSPPAYHYVHGLPGSMTVDLSPRLRSLARAIQARYADMRFCGMRRPEGPFR